LPERPGPIRQNEPWWFPVPRATCLMAFVLTAAGYARSELPVTRYTVARKPSTVATCVFRQAQAAAGSSELVNQGKLDEPEEWQVTKVYRSVLAWELDLTPHGVDGSLLTLRHLPSLLDWEGT
jgi:hypothetical protein